jgi:hypothetical protein
MRGTVLLRLGATIGAVGFVVAACRPLPDARPHRLETDMPSSAAEEGSYFIRTDFSDQAAWRSTLETVVARHGIFKGTFHVVDDPTYTGATPEQIVARLGPGFEQTFMFVADSTTISHPDRPVLVVDLWEGSLDEFRAVPSEVAAIQINLAIANMDFEEFAGAADPDGIFRGF